MRTRSLILLGAAALLTPAAGLAQAQEKAAPPPPAAAAPATRSAPSDEPKLILDREVFSFPAGARRDPYTPLLGKNDAGPRFEDLSLRGIIYSASGLGMVLLSDGRRTYRAHSGEMVGNARIVRISPTRVIFSVDNFGVWREESLEMKKSEGAKG